MTLDDIKKEIEEAKNIVILTHENPDGDAVGSSLASYLVLKKLGKNVDIVSSIYPRTYNFLPHCDETLREPKNDKYDLVISLDCADIKRLDDPTGIFEKTKVKINIDHHSSNGMFGDYNFVDPVSPACCQILTMIFEYWGIEIDKDIATCLLTGIITDTGGFRYEGVSSDTFEYVSEFLEKGVNLSKIYKQSMQTISRSRFKIRNLAASRVEFLADGKIAFTYLTKKDMEELGVLRSELDGIAENGRDVEGVEVSIFLYELDNGFKASLRSNDYVNVADICLLFNGGGHIKAAGATLPYSLEESKERIIAAVEKALK